MKYIITILTLVLTLTACGGGSGNKANPSAQILPLTAVLDGTWFGNIEFNDDNSLHSITVTISSNIASSSTNITEVLIDDIVDGTTGKLSTVSNTTNVYTLTTLSNVVIRIMTDANNEYFTFVTSLGNFGVLQRGRETSPTYNVANINSRWIGRWMITDFSNQTLNNGILNVPCIAQNCEYINGMVDYLTFDAVYVYWTGIFFFDNGDLGISSALLSPDMKYLASYVCDASMAVERCTFYALSRK